MFFIFDEFDGLCLMNLILCHVVYDVFDVIFDEFDVLFLMLCLMNLMFLT